MINTLVDMEPATMAKNKEFIFPSTTIDLATTNYSIKRFIYRFSFGDFGRLALVDKQYLQHYLVTFPRCRYCRLRELDVHPEELVPLVFQFLEKIVPVHNLESLVRVIVLL